MNRDFYTDPKPMQPHFIGCAELEQCADGRNFSLAQSFGFWTRLTGLITVPAKFQTDLASIPKLFWNILPPFGKYTEAAVIHDYLYRTHITARCVADRTLLAGMRVCRVAPWQRVVIYGAVRWFGGFAWRDDSRFITVNHRYGGKHLLGLSN